MEAVSEVNWDYFKWKDDYATIYDYSQSGGPTCIVPLKKLFATKYFVDLKSRASFSNNNGNWTNTYQLNHEIANLILGHKAKWEIL